MRPLNWKTLEKYLHQPCETEDQLHAWIEAFTSLKMPRQSVCAHHVSPFEYVRRAYFQESPDLIVWASRGGGKTRLAALVTLLDLLHKPGCSVRILGGSLEQSLKIWEHLLPDVQYLAWKQLVKNRQVQMRRISFKNESTAAILTQSEYAVRGLRVQKLRCDEVDLFKPQIWNAAQFVTRSKQSPSNLITGSIEALSTFHKPYGLMKQIIDRATELGKPILKWCLLEVLEKCPPERSCATCPLWDECKGVAKTKCDGFYRIDDAIVQKSRVSKDKWDAEMLCNRPIMQDCVFPNFNPAIHVQNDGVMSDSAMLDLAIDFGFHNPFVCLWIRDDGTNCHVIDEYVQEQQVMANHVEQIESRKYGSVRRICCDPAGAGRNDQTAESNIQYLRRRGYKVLSRGSRIIDGVELIRTALQPAMGNPTLFIHPHCKRMIAAMRQLRYPDGGGELPIKDGTHDHLVDALRYFYVNRGRGKVQGSRKY